MRSKNANAMMNEQTLRDMIRNNDTQKGLKAINIEEKIKENLLANF